MSDHTEDSRDPALQATDPKDDQREDEDVGDAIKIYLC